MAFQAGLELPDRSSGDSVYQALLLSLEVGLKLLQARAAREKDVSELKRKVDAALKKEREAVRLKEAAQAEMESSRLPWPRLQAALVQAEMEKLQAALRGRSSRPRCSLCWRRSA